MSESQLAAPLPLERLPRTYYAKRLLEHGRLSRREFTEITGWSMDEASHVLTQLVDTEVAARVHERGCNYYLYELR